ncbi:hypothetical protein CASFOL_016439 [Castilleja foliolosa]|uniref:Uncharacterized protein n=1 Tax=Castilleja foliolosa TaxID=1961234 RepID=A0ABD3DKN7_9LAMI
MKSSILMMCLAVLLALITPSIDDNKNIVRVRLLEEKVHVVYVEKKIV